MSVTYRFVPGFGERYRVGDDGSVWSHRGVKGWCRLKPERHNWVTHGRRAKRYLRVNLYRDGKAFPFLVHQLVLLAFVGPCPAGMEVRHFPDPDPDNNRLDNLTYGTKRQNYMDWVACGGGFEGSKGPNSKLTEDERAEVVRLVASGLSQSAIGKRYGLHQTTIHHIVKRARTERESCNNTGG